METQTIEPKLSKNEIKMAHVREGQVRNRAKVRAEREAVLALSKTQLVAKTGNPQELATILWDSKQEKPVKLSKDLIQYNKVCTQYNKLLTRVTKEIQYFLKTNVNDRSDETLARNKKALHTVKELVTVIKAMKELKDTLSDKHLVTAIPQIQEESIKALEDAKIALKMVGYSDVAGAGINKSLSRL